MKHNQGVLRLAGRLVKAYRSIHIRWKIFLAYILILLATLPVLIGTSIRYLESAAQQQYMTAIDHSLECLRADLKNRLELQSNLADTLVWQSGLRNILDKSGNGYTFSEQMKDMEALKRITQPHITGMDIRVFALNSAIYTRERSTIFAVEGSAYESLYKRMVSAGKSHIWGVGLWMGQKQFVCLASICAEDDIFENVGYLSAGMPVEKYQTLLQAACPTERTRLFLLDEDGGAVLSDDGYIPENFLFPANGESVLLSGETVVCRNIPLNDDGWRIAALIPEADLNMLPRNGVMTYMPVAAAVLVVALILSALLSKSLTRRLTRLAGLVSRYSIDRHVELVTEDGYDDEIGALQNICNQMILRNEELLQRVYLTDIEKRKAEMRALQAQITPHFLYNTLNAIQWLAVEEHAGRTAEAIQMLSAYYRIVLRENGNVIPLAQEIEHARAYLDIQKLRMQDALQYEFDIPLELERNVAIRLLLQPLVENSIVHGLYRAPAQGGCVTVSARAEGDRLIIIVEDNGAGLNGNPLEACPNHGVQNTDRRIRMTFGEEYGLRYEPVATGGTRVIVEIPLREL